MQPMAKQNQETVRRLLEAALESLDRQSPGDNESSNSILLSENKAGAPVILVLGGGLNAQGENTSPAPSGGSGRWEAGRSFAPNIDQSRGSAHPGLERFHLSISDSLPHAPKACFMEPGRTCVNSGACEMRGF